MIDIPESPLPAVDPDRAPLEKAMEVEVVHSLGHLLRKLLI
jgi:hypothetical protein